mgnify:CR=1 FL=1
MPQNTLLEDEPSSIDAPHPLFGLLENLTNPISIPRSKLKVALEFCNGHELMWFSQVRSLQLTDFND